MVLEGVDVCPLTDARGRAAGELLARSRSKDVIDAALVLLVVDGDEILTSDVGDLARVHQVRLSERCDSSAVLGEQHWTIRIPIASSFPWLAVRYGKLERNDGRVRRDLQRGRLNDLTRRKAV